MYLAYVSQDTLPQEFRQVRGELQQVIGSARTYLPLWWLVTSRLLKHCSVPLL
jgi:hypothetical protein